MRISKHPGRSALSHTQLEPSSQNEPPKFGFFPSGFSKFKMKRDASWLVTCTTALDKRWPR